jgi:hypothetical protein
MARSNVAESKSMGWCLVIVAGQAKGWAYRYRLRLECGHTKLFTSEPFHNRCRDVPPPAWVECKACDIEPSRGQ